MAAGPPRSSFPPAPNSVGWVLAHTHPTVDSFTPYLRRRRRKANMMRPITPATLNKTTVDGSGISDILIESYAPLTLPGTCCSLTHSPPIYAVAGGRAT